MRSCPRAGASQTMLPQSDFANHIISSLSSADFDRIAPNLVAVDLPLRKVLERRRRSIGAVYFPESGFASVVADGGHPIEIGLIGREGMTGLSLILGDEAPDNETFMQAAGRGQCLNAKTLRRHLDESASLKTSLLRYAHSFLKQTARTAVANGRSKIEERLARWILMADDRIDGDELPLTHEFLSMMLGVRRPGVTIAAQALERSGVIARKRGCIIILDRRALEKMSNGTYVPADYR
jgi:CRP-like cAMP-binding protein